ncbi:S-methyl-5'-thioadenosine phosphorylase [bacterium]|nr:S-methyl-5'-thioadenosine phosphorylase [bacterium]
MIKQAQIGIFGGSGFYKFLDNIEEISIETPYGETSDKIMLGKIANKDVAFMPRHGRNHSIAPHKVNYRANVWAMKQMGCKCVISPCAAGSLQTHVKPGDIVFCDQYVDRTHSRCDTYFEYDKIEHVSAADPYCPKLREIAIDCAKNLGLSFHDKGTIVVIQGPRFNTKAESAFYTKHGWEVVNMTQYPEVHLVKELGMKPLNISLITDYDAGLVADCEPVSHQAVMKIFEENISNLRKLLFSIVENIPDELLK